jgi:alpha-glucosidase
VLPGSEPGKVVGFARRHGQDWYIGMLNANIPNETTIDLSFLGSGTYHANIFGDDSANPAAFKQQTRALTAKDSLSPSLSVRGGYVAWITKETH